eukprot:g4809.t1
MDDAIGLCGATLGEVRDTWTGVRLCGDERGPTWTVEADKPTTVCYNDSWASAKYVTETCVTLTFDTEKLTLQFEVSSDPLQANAFARCDDEVYNQEVVEVFISNLTSTDKPDRYWEVELSPRGVAWLGFDLNPGGDRSNFSNHVYPCDLIESDVHTLPNSSSWMATMHLPFDIISRGTDATCAAGRPCRHYRANFFRVQMNPDPWGHLDRPVTTNDTCGPANCTFTCANCPRTDAPDFHHSGYFGDLYLLLG